MHRKAPTASLIESNIKSVRRDGQVLDQDRQCRESGDEDDDDNDDENDENNKNENDRCRESAEEMTFSTVGGEQIMK